MPLLHDAYLPVERMETLDAALALARARTQSIWAVEPEDVLHARLLADSAREVGAARPAAPGRLPTARSVQDPDIDRICTRPTAVDLDGDGKLDIVSGNFRGTFHFFAGQGKGKFAPKSTLLMLVSAFAGRERVLAAYREAVRQGYRFYSYGDAMLIV